MGAEAGETREQEKKPGLEFNCLESSFVEKALGILEDNKLTMS